MRTAIVTEGRAITLAWLALTAITVVSFGLAPGHTGVGPRIAVSVAAIVLGFVKCRIIVRYFMEVRSAPRWLRHGTDAWLAALWTALLVIYLW